MRNILNQIVHIVFVALGLRAMPIASFRALADCFNMLPVVSIVDSSREN